MFSKTTQSEGHVVISREDLEEIEDERCRLDEPTLRQAAAKLRKAEDERFSDSIGR